MLADLMRREAVRLTSWIRAAVTTTTATNQPTRYSGQKRILTLSDGSLLCVIPKTGSNVDAYFYRSTDGGKTWAQYVETIAGWNDGSISSYVDSGGNERFLTVWKQYGTGDSRIDGAIYTMVGTFNIAKTTITWSAAVQVAGSSSGIMMPDCVVAAEGTGGAGHVVYSSNVSSTQTTKYCRISITNAGVPTAGSIATISGSFTIAGAHTYPSIDMSLSSKRLMCAWVAGPAQPGIFFATASYSAGSWTWGGAVQFSSYYVDSSNDTGFACRFDGSRPVIAGQFKATNGSKNIQVYDSVNYLTFIERVHVLTDSSTFIGNASMAIDANANIYIFGSSFDGTYFRDLVYYKITRSGVDLSIGSRIKLDPFPMSSSSTAAPFPNVFYYRNKMHVLYNRGSDSPYPVYYGGVNV